MALSNMENFDWNRFKSGNAFEKLTYLGTYAINYGLDWSKQSALADRDYTAMREDTAVQRRVADMQAAGLNPYTIGTSAASATQSVANTQNLTNTLSLLGSILDIGNLSARNRQITNNLITDILGTVLGFFKK